MAAPVLVSACTQPAPSRRRRHARPRPRWRRPLLHRPGAERFCKFICGSCRPMRSGPPAASAFLERSNRPCRPSCRWKLRRFAVRSGRCAVVLCSFDLMCLSAKPTSSWRNSATIGAVGFRSGVRVEQTRNSTLHHDGSSWAKVQPARHKLSGGFGAPRESGAPGRPQTP